MNIKKVSFVVKKTTYQKVELTENSWGLMPSNCLELVEFSENIKTRPGRFCAKEKWEKAEFEFQELEIEEHETTCEPVAQETPCNNEIPNAIKVLKQAMIDDGPSELGSYAHSWHCNIAMACFDTIKSNKVISNTNDTVAHDVGNETASRFMKLLFDVETTNNPPEKEYNNAKQKTST
jgi:hypothetical protein